LKEQSAQKGTRFVASMPVSQIATSGREPLNGCKSPAVLTGLIPRKTVAGSLSG